MKARWSRRRLTIPGLLLLVLVSVEGCWPEVARGTMTIAGRARIMQMMKAPAQRASA